jgi:hypothetical protein
MTEKDKLIKAIENASNEELGAFYARVTGTQNPFVKHRLTLPSVVRDKTIKAIKQLINTNQLKWEKVS